MQRQWKHTLAGVALILALGGTPATAAEIQVGVNGCTLQDAIRAANSDTATGGCPAGSGADTITLPPGSTFTYTSPTDHSFGAAALPAITSNITIEGNGSTIRRQGPNWSDFFRLITVRGSGELTLNNTTVTGGREFFSAPFSPEKSGGGIVNLGNSVTLNNSTVFNNWSLYGGGVANLNDLGTVTLNNSTITSNIGAMGGGLHVRGTATVNNSLIANNTARFIGVAEAYGQPYVAGEAGSGGGIYIGEFSTAIVHNSTISGNESTDGGGIYILNGTASVHDSTIVGNRATRMFSFSENFGRGGGIFAAGDLTLSHTIVSGNVSNASAGPGAGAGREVYSFAAVRSSDDFNLFGHSGRTSAEALFRFTPGATDITATSDGTTPTALFAILDTTLTDNGGPTLTHALVGGSPAIDAVPAESCPASLTDQRGFLRPVDGDGAGGASCDIGAFEFGSAQDADGDGVIDSMDACPGSDLSATVVIGSCNSGVANALDGSGCSISDYIAKIAATASDQDAFVTGVSQLTNGLMKARVLTGQQKGAIQKCAEAADIP